MRQIIVLILLWMLWVGPPGGHVVPLPIPLPGPVKPNSPVPGQGYNVLIVESRSDRPTLLRERPGVYHSMFSAATEEAIAKRGGQLYRYDRTQDVSRKDDWVKTAMKVRAETYPWYVIDHNGKGEMGPVPDDPAAFVKILEKY